MATRKEHYSLFPCPMCGRRFKAARRHANTCSPRCRMRFWRWQRKGGNGPEHFEGLQISRA